MVGHVRIVSILMMVQRFARLVGWSGADTDGDNYGILLESISDNPQFRQGNGPSAEFTANMVVGIYGGLGVVIGIIGSMSRFRWISQLEVQEPHAGDRVVVGGSWNDL